MGLAITQSISLTSLIQWGIRQSTEVSNQLMSVERVLEYSQLPSEPNFRDKGENALKKCKKIVNPGKDIFLILPQNWPHAGCIEFKDVYLRYADQELPVLKGLTLKIDSTEKVI